VLPALGRLILVGIAMEALELAAAPIVLKELEIRGAITYRRAEFQEAIDLLAAGRIPAERLITAAVPLADAEQAFRDLTAPGTEQIKILLTP
jgi:(R,R)-butanediol dehydrogenase / meso-butanediol dehydrogenase / diacetyl reductase